MHDECYGQCTPGGALNGSEACDYLKCKRGGSLFGSSDCDGKSMVLNRNASGARKLACDRKLGSDIALLNADSPLCSAFGQIYKLAVNVLGESSWSGVDNVGQRQSKSEYESALRQFLENASEDQLRDFVKSAAEGKLQIDFEKPIRYSPTGLSNK